MKATVESNKPKGARTDLSSPKQPHVSLARPRFLPGITRSAFAPCILLVALVAGTFIPCLWNDFVNYDDPPYVTQNAVVQNGFTLRSIGWAFSTNEQGNWHPLTWLSHMLDCQLFGLRPWGHHFSNLLLHTLTTLLLFSVLKRMTGALWRSFFVAALFGLHPLRVESVAWVAERKDVLSAFFWMLTLWMYVRFSEVRQISPSRTKTFYLGALACFAVGLMSKPMLVTLPFVLLLLDYWPLRRFAQEKSKLLILEKLPFVLLAAISSILTYSAQHSVGAVVATEHLPLGFRFENALVSCCRYLGKLLYPVKLAVFYPLVPQWPILNVLGAALVVVSLSACAFVFFRERPYFFVGWFWFLGTLVPVIGLVQVGAQSMADRYSYIPSIGLFIVLVWAASDLAQRFRSGTIAGSVAGSVAVAACVGLTCHQIAYWKDSGSLFRRALAVTQNNCIAWTNLGNYTLDQGRTDDAIDQLEQAVRLRPSFAQPHLLLGTALYLKGRHDMGMSEIELAIRLDPNNVPAHFNLAAILEQQGRLNEAITQFNEVIRLKPFYAEAYDGLGFALQQRGETAQAISQFRKALEIKPADGKAYQGLGEAMQTSGSVEPAVQYFRKALSFKPNDAEIHKNLGVALAKQGRRDEAISHLSEAVKLRPNYSEAQAALRALSK